MTRTPHCTHQLFFRFNGEPQTCDDERGLTALLRTLRGESLREQARQWQEARERDREDRKSRMNTRGVAA